MSATTTTTCAAELSGLWRLAKYCGVMPAYTSVTGERRRASPDAILHALQVLGVDIESPAHADLLLRSLCKVHEQALLDPVSVVWRPVPDRATPGGAIHLTLHVRAEQSDSRIEVRLFKEDGDVAAWHVALKDVPASGKRGATVQKRLSIGESLSFGYHRLDINCDGESHHSWLFVAPHRACPLAGRTWGAFAPVYASRREHNWGIGDFSDLKELANWIGTAGGSYFATLPLLATYCDGATCDPSPYMPLSRRFWNEVFLDVEASPEFARSERARALVGSPGFQHELRRLRSSQSVDYVAISRCKRAVLELLAEEQCNGSGAFGHDATVREVEGDVEVQRYAQFRAAGDRYGRSWRKWPAAAREGRMNPTDLDERSIRYHLYAQQLCKEQLKSAAVGGAQAGCGLYLDLPVGVHPDGFDTWRWRESFALEATAGAPPDEFFSHGQNWGLTPLHPQQSRRDGHTYMRAVIAEHMKYAQALRIDHVMWMQRMYWVPAGSAADDGVYVRYPADELFAIVCIESQRRGVPVVGENLGTVPESINRKMSRHGIHPLYVGQFACTGDVRKPLEEPPKNAVSSMNTHDTPTFAEFWKGGDIDRRLKAGLLTPDQAADEASRREEIRQSALTFARLHRVRLRASGNSEEDIVILMRALLGDIATRGAAMTLIALEDLWAEEKPHNIPGTNGRHNWRRKVRYTLEEMRQLPQVTAAFEQLREVLS